MFHEPQNEMLIKKELMAKARIYLEIVFTSLKGGAKFKKEHHTERSQTLKELNLNNPGIYPGDQNSDG
jgi:hypothetical protein